MEYNVNSGVQDFPTTGISTKSTNLLSLPKTTQEIPIAKPLLTCICSRSLVGLVGLKAHQRICSVFKRLVAGPWAVNDINDIAQPSYQQCVLNGLFDLQSADSLHNNSLQKNNNKNSTGLTNEIIDRTNETTVIEHSQSHGLTD